MRTRLVLAFLALLPAACGDDGGERTAADAGVTADARDSADAGPTADAAPGAPSLGQVLVLEGTRYWRDGAPSPIPYSYIGGRFVDVPEPGWHQEAMTSGACRLLVYELAFCEMPCNGVCFEGDVCRPWPTYLSAGALTFSGLTRAATVSPDPYDNFYNHPLPRVAELFTDDATIGVAAAGGSAPAFSGSVRGVPRLEPAIEAGAITLENGVDHTVRWTPAPGSDSRVRLTINSANGTHGAPWDAIIECDAPDSAGAITIPAAMVDAFPATDVWFACVGRECPPSWIRRYRESLVPVPGGTVSLLVGSELEFGVVHDRD